jgi:hypothetical protein
MKRLMELTVKLYPVAWRKRYEVEFAALLEDVRPGWRTAFDVLRGAMLMQLRTVGFWRIVCLAGLSGFLIGFGMWVASPKQYVSQAVINIEARGASRAAINDAMTVLARTVFSNKSLTTIIQHRNLYSEERKKTQLEDVIAEMREHVVFNSDGSASALLRFTSSDRFISQAVTDDLVRSFMEVEVDFRLPLTLQLTEAPTVGRSPFPPVWIKLTAIGLMLGLAAGVCAGFLRDSIRPRPV